MQEETAPPQKASLRRQEITITLIAAAIILSLLTVGVVAAYLGAKTRTGTIVLPGGVTYLGPSTTPTPPLVVSEEKISIPNDARWSLYKGKLFPYTFSYPATLSLGWFINDPFDGVTFFLKNTDSQQNIFFRVEDLSKIPDQTKYIKQPKIEYARNWWRQYTWKGVGEIIEFTNAQGLKGYRAKYIDSTGKSPFDHVFFEVPGKPELVLWLSGKLFDQMVFDRIANSVTWQPSPSAAPSPGQ